MFPQRNTIAILASGLVAVCCLCLVSVSFAREDFSPTERAGWLLERGNLETFALTGERFEQGEIGGGGSGSHDKKRKYAGDGKGVSAVFPILASAVLPGAGEALMGHKRGYLMMALDIACWAKVAHSQKEADDLTAAYYDYADAHYSDELLVEAYNGASNDLERQGEGPHYFPGVTQNIPTAEDLHLLPLYVTVEEDRREYYENLGKWDQFIFGWDDYIRASEPQPDYDYEPTNTISDLRTPWVSKRRDIYRTMRSDANSAYQTRDRFMYFNIGLRVFSVMQVAYLNGLLGGSDDQLEVAGHTIEIITEPQGFSRGLLAARVSF